MKFFKRLAPIVLVLILVLAMVPTSAFACYPCATYTVQMKDSTGTQNVSASFSAYKIIAWDINYTTTSPYTITSYKAPLAIQSDAYRSVIRTAVGAGSATLTDTQLVGMLSTLDGDASKSAALGASLQGAIGTTAPTATTTTGLFSGLERGYYLIIQNTGSGAVLAKPILVAIPKLGESVENCGRTINVKSSTANIEKKIVIGSALYDSSTAAVGDTVNYQSLSTFPTFATTATNIVYYVDDTFSAGLTPNDDIVAKIVSSSGAVVKTLVENTDYTLTTTASTFKLELTNQDDIKTWGNAGNKLLLTYSAVINQSATYGSTGNPNSTKLTFGEGGKTATTDEDTVISYIVKLVVLKNDNAATPVKLAGATFTLSKKDSGTATYTVIETQTTDANGQAVFTKLSQGDYRLTETVAPTGYKLLTTSTDFTVTAKNGTVTIPNTSILQTNIGNAAAIANFKATWTSSNAAVVVGADGNLSATIVNEPDVHLPGTGGIGTTIFTVSGILLLLLASVLFVVYNKKHKKSEN